MSRIQQLKKLLDLDEQDSDVLYMLAQEHAKQGEYDAAVDWYDRCLDAERTHCYAYFHKAKALQAKGDTPEARRTLEDGVQAAREVEDDKAIAELAEYLRQLEE